MDGTLYVTTLGQFSLRYPTAQGPGELTSQSGTSWRLWTFLQYLCVFHDRAVTQEEVFDLLWNDIDSANPASTVKTLLHRSRLALEKLGFPNGKDVLRYRRGLYTWDPELEIKTDTDEFDRLCAEFDAGRGSEEGLAAARSAIALYGGDFLPSAAGSPWVLSPRTYYHGRFLRLCCDAANSLWELGRREEAVDVCRAATAVDPYDETCHLLTMRLLHASGAKQAAIQYYSDVSNLLMAQLGITPSEELTGLYRELSGGGGGEEPEMDLRAILGGLQEAGPGSGAFVCDYNVFKDIYSLMLRSALRSGQAVQLSLMTLLDADGGQLPQARRAAGMEALLETIAGCCRAGDVCAQYNSSQYLLLLPTASYENGTMVIRRILDAFQRTVMGMTTSVQCSTISALAPDQRESSAPAGWKWKPMKM